MTIIAWDGTTLAADRRASQGGLGYAVTKIERINGTLVAYTGDVCTALELKQWWKEGCIPSNFPESCRKAYEQTLITITPKGKILVYTCGPYPLEILQMKHAWGAGRDFALAAMHYNKSAIEAVNCAVHFQTDCGHGVDALTLEL